MRQLPAGCGYQGYEFGAAYPDSLCCGGRLYDCDDCDDKGNLYEPAENIPCPMCHPRKAVEYYIQQNISSGVDQEAATIGAKSLVADIRRNRKNGTEPWKGTR